MDEDVKNFKNVLLDGKLVDSSMYKVKSGSTIVEFTKEFKNSLTEGTHNIEFKFKNGYAKTQFFVLDKKEDSQKDKNKNKPIKPNNSNIKNKPIKPNNSNIKNKLPKTNISNSSIFLAVTSLVEVLYSKKKNK